MALNSCFSKKKIKRNNTCNLKDASLFYFKQVKIMSKIFIITILLLSTSLLGWERYDKVLAVVNGSPIIESEVNQKLNQIRRQKRFPNGKTKYYKSRVLDSFIQDELVQETARTVSIIVSDNKIFNEITNYILNYHAQKIKNPKKIEELKALKGQIKNRLKERFVDLKGNKNKKIDAYIDPFVAVITKTKKISFDAYIRETKSQIMKQQLMSIAVGITPPNKKEIKAWYWAHKKKFGMELRYKQIKIYTGKSLFGQRNASKKLNKIRARVLKGESFEKLARQYSQDRATKYKGGDVGWVHIGKIDRMVAGRVYQQLKRPGQISVVFKSLSGAYYLIKYVGRRPIPYEKVKKMIMYKLYNEKLAQQFNKWVETRKKYSDIKIFMPGYTR